jgi:hypothetical protein
VRINPMGHLGSAGLLWHVAGGKLKKLQVDWALIDNNGAQRVFHRRDANCGGHHAAMAIAVIKGRTTVALAVDGSSKSAIFSLRLADYR